MAVALQSALQDPLRLEAALFGPASLGSASLLMEGEDVRGVEDTESGTATGAALADLSSVLARESARAGRSSSGAGEVVY